MNIPGVLAIDAKSRLRWRGGCACAFLAATCVPMRVFALPWSLACAWRDWQESEPRTPAMNPCPVLRRLLAQRNKLMGLLSGAITHIKSLENASACTSTVPEIFDDDRDRTVTAIASVRRCGRTGTGARGLRLGFKVSCRWRTERPGRCPGRGS